MTCEQLRIELNGLASSSMKGIDSMDLLSNDILSDLSAMADEEAEMLKKLYPPLPDGYFNDKPDALKKQPSSPLERIYTWYNYAPMKPYIHVKNMNPTNDGEVESAPKSSIELGIKFSF